MTSSNKDKSTGTRLVEAGRKADWTGTDGQPRVVNPPIWRGSTHLYASEAERIETLKDNNDGTFYYGRRGAPTQWALAQALTEMEPGAHGTVLYPSGTAAIAASLMSVLRPGNSVLIADNSYEPTRTTGLGILKRFGVEARFFDPLDLAAYAAAFDETTKAVWLESPGSLTMEVSDVPALAAIAREHGAVSLIDNTWASPLGLAPLALGCDISVMSLTKHVGGHSDLMMGSASASEKYYRRLRQTSQQLGHVVSPDDAALALRGLRTMGLRLERTTATAITVANWLKSRPEIAHVMCPMLEGDAGYDLWSRDFTGACGLFSFTLKNGTKERRAALVDALELFGIGYSWGGFESLALVFDAQTTRSATAWPPAGFEANDGLGIRLSIGLEDADDLIADLDQALAVSGDAG
ncbi:MAG: cystathionine beta-lyase [Marinomonas sp.]